MQAHIIILTIVGLAFIPEVIWIVQLFRNKAQESSLPKITFRINCIVLILGSALLALAVIYDVNFLRYKAPMEYSSWKEITWSDFRAIKRPHQTLEGSVYFAFISTEIKVQQNPDKAEVRTYFHPSRSYTYNEKNAGDDLLRHEIYHLHITEYWARLIRKNFAELGRESDNAEFVNAYLHRENEWQYQYDTETAHGYLLGKQRSWQTKIDSCLMSLEKYSDPVINFK